MSPNAPISIATLRRALAARAPAQASEPVGATAAVALVLVPAPDDFELLFIRRADRPGDPWSGQMALPGGRRDPPDPSLLATACRETLEETGVFLHTDDCVGVLDDLRPTTPTLPPVTVRPFVFAPDAKPEVVLNPEATRHQWIPLGTLWASRGRARVTVRDRHRDVEAFLVEPDVIWGMTHRIIMPFLDLVNMD